jgi:hypothetical protein
MANKHCQRKCEKPKKPCHKAERYDSWSKSDSSCEKPKCRKRCYKVCEIVCEQKKKQEKEWGHKVREDGSWTSVEECGKLSSRKNHHKKH